MSEKGLDVESLRIPAKEKENIRQLRLLLESAAKELKHQLETEVVGGVVTKEWPRKDIDMSCRILDIMGETKGMGNFEIATKSLGILEEISRKALAGRSDFRIRQVVNPYQDNRYDDPNILEHNGSIVVQPRHGVSIELINNSI